MCRGYRRHMGGTQITERPRLAGPGTGLGRHSRVIVLNDDHNTFEGVAALLARVLPGTSYDRGMELATQVHVRGSACVWQGEREVAELYWEQLASGGLTMAPLE